jgi:hypothetical protein
MTTIEKLQEMLGIKIIENYNGHCYDLEVGEYETADNYTLHVVTEDAHNIQFDTDVFYYEPSVDVILDRITALHAGATVWIADIETYLPDYEVEDWINSNADIETPEQV